MSTSTAVDPIRATRLGYGTRVRYLVAAAAASVAITAGVAIAVNAGSDSSASSATPLPSAPNRVDFGFAATRASAVTAGQAFHHRTGQTLRATASRDVTASQAAQRFHHR